MLTIYILLCLLFIFYYADYLYFIVQYYLYFTGVTGTGFGFDLGRCENIYATRIHLLIN